MNFIAIAKRVEKQIPYADALEISRMCTLMCGAVRDIATLSDDKKFLEIWDEVNLRLQAATDQHVAVSEDGLISNRLGSNLFLNVDSNNKY